MNYEFIKSYQSIAVSASLPRMGLILGPTRSWRYIYDLMLRIWSEPLYVGASLVSTHATPRMQPAGSNEA